MKKLIVSSVAFFLLTFALHAQNPFPLKVDTTKTGLLGFNKQNRSPLLLNYSIEYPDLKIQGFANANTNEAYSEWNMPVHKPQSNHPMPIQVPDSTINYSMIIVRPESN